MYPISVSALRSVFPGRGARAPRFSSNVLGLGFTSLFTDISSEMVTSVLPLFLVVHLQLSPAALGAIDGLHQAGASLFRLVSGFVADHWGRYRRLAALGYGLSALSKLALLGAQSALGIGLSIGVDRVGKGLRTSPRDALISLSVPHAELGRAFGVHRTLDSAGALIGPLLAFGVLHLAPAAYDAVFVVSFALATVGVAVIVSFVRDPGPGTPASARVPAGLALRQAAQRLRGERGFGTLLLGAAGLGLLTVGDSFVYLILQRRHAFEASYLPLLYVATPAVYMLLALPLGSLADRWGRSRVLLVGYVALLSAYATQLIPLPAAVALPLTIALLGMHYAATDGVLMALASALLPPNLRASGIALSTTAHQLGRMLAGVGFGLLWARHDIQSALLAFSGGGLLLLGAVAILLCRLRPEETHG